MDVGTPSAAPAPDLAELSSCVERVLSREIQGLRTSLHHDLQKEMTEIKSLLKAAAQQPHPAPKPKLKHQFTARSERSGMSGGEHEEKEKTHAWVGRSVRSYAAAVEIAAMTASASESSSNSSGAHGLLPREMPKGSGPLARSRRAHSNASAHSSSANARHIQGKYHSKSAADARRHSRVSSDPVSPSHQSDACNVGKNLPQEQRIECGMTSSCSEPQFGRQISPDSFDSGAMPVPSTSHSAGFVSETSAASESSDGVVVQKRTTGKTNKSTAVLHLQTIPSQKTLSFERIEPSLSRMRRTLKLSHCRAGMLKAVNSIYFDYLTVLFIVANAATIGLQTDYMARNLQEHAPHSFQVIDIMFSVFFAVEVAMRLLAHGLRFFVMPSWKWNVLDLSVVSMQLLEELMVALRLGESQLPVALSLMRMLRILRLVRVLRVVRLLRYMSELRTLVVSIMGSVKPLVSSVGLLALVIYMIAIYFTQLVLHHRLDMGCGQVGRCDSEEAMELSLRFGSVGVTVLHLFQSVTGGLEWNNMAGPLMASISPWMGLMYCVYIIFTSLALMNLVTGVFVESALQRGREDKDTYMINHLRDLFFSMDMNRSGTISWCELQDHLDDPKLISFFRDVDIDISEARGLFDLLDRDASGTIDADEFLGGCLRLRGAAKAIDLQLVMCELAEQRRSFQKLLAALENSGSED